MRVRLAATLPRITGQPLIYIRATVPQVLIVVAEVLTAGLVLDAQTLRSLGRRASQCQVDDFVIDDGHVHSGGGDRPVNDAHLESGAVLCLIG